jgi:imidazoleglycerol phosphate dehydratase HisB
VRSGSCERVSSETSVAATIELDGCGRREISTGLLMLDHLLAQFAFHSRCNLDIAVRSLDGIEHHLIEDVALALGEALAAALSERRGIARYGCALIPMDDALVRAAVDFGGRPFARVGLDLAARRVEGLEVAMIPHFFSSLAWKAGITLHLDLLVGSDPHHAIEACFKAFARASTAAWSQTASDAAALPSTKGIL